MKSSLSLLTSVTLLVVALCGGRLTSSSLAQPAKLVRQGNNQHLGSPPHVELNKLHLEPGDQEVIIMDPTKSEHAVELAKELSETGRKEKVHTVDKILPDGRKVTYEIVDELIEDEENEDDEQEEEAPVEQLVDEHEVTLPEAESASQPADKVVPKKVTETAEKKPTSSPSGNDSEPKQAPISQAQNTATNVNIGGAVVPPSQPQQQQALHQPTLQKQKQEQHVQQPSSPDAAVALDDDTEDATSDGDYKHSDDGEKEPSSKKPTNKNRAEPSKKSSRSSEKSSGKKSEQAPTEGQVQGQKQQINLIQSENNPADEKNLTEPLSIDSNGKDDQTDGGLQQNQEQQINIEQPASRAKSNSSAKNKVKKLDSNAGEPNYDVDTDDDDDFQGDDASRKIIKPKTRKSKKVKSDTSETEDGTNDKPVIKKTNKVSKKISKKEGAKKPSEPDDESEDLDEENNLSDSSSAEHSSPSENDVKEEDDVMEEKAGKKEENHPGNDADNEGLTGKSSANDPKSKSKSLPTQSHAGPATDNQAVAVDLTSQPRDSSDQPVNSATKVDVAPEVQPAPAVPSAIHTTTTNVQQPQSVEPQAPKQQVAPTNVAYTTNVKVGDLNSANTPLELQNNQLIQPASTGIQTIVQPSGPLTNERHDGIILDQAVVEPNQTVIVEEKTTVRNDELERAGDDDRDDEETIEIEEGGGHRRRQRRGRRGRRHRGWGRRRGWGRG